MKRIQIHESGSISLIEASNDSVKIEKTNPNGKPDKIVREVEAGKMNDKEWGKMLEKPNNFNVERFGIREIKKSGK